MFSIAGQLVAIKVLRLGKRLDLLVIFSGFLDFMFYWMDRLEHELKLF